jgi:hypothetical protein
MGINIQILSFVANMNFPKNSISPQGSPFHPLPKTEFLSCIDLAKNSPLCPVEARSFALG